jgi:hypothetical protein
MLGPAQQAREGPMSESNSPVPEWMAVLERIEGALEQALSLAPEVAPAPPRDAGGQPDPLHLIDERLQRWQGCLEQVEGQSGRAEEDLEQDQAALRQWQQNAARLREMLAAWVKRAV